MAQVSIILLSIFFPINSFSLNDKGELEYAKLQKLEHQALKRPAGKIYIYDLTGKKNCNKSRIKYLGVIHTSKRKSYKILTTFFVFSASSTCHGTSSIKVFDMRNKYVGEYYVGMPEGLPDALKKNKLVYLENSGDCNLRKSRSISFEKGLPKRIFLPCSKTGGDEYFFSSGE